MLMSVGFNMLFEAESDRVSLKNILSLVFELSRCILKSLIIRSLPIQTMLASRNYRNSSLNSGTDSLFDGDGGGL